MITIKLISVKMLHSSTQFFVFSLIFVMIQFGSTLADQTDLNQLNDGMIGSSFP